MAVVNVNNLLNGKDSRWLQLEVCREFQRNKCTRSDTECKFAHPPANVEVQNGRVTACYDSIKGRCNRDKPPCKYFHPPQHLKDQLLINGRNHLALKNALLQQMGLAPGQPIVPNQMPAVDVAGKLQFPTSSAAAAAATAIALGQPQLGLMTSPYLPGVPQVGNTFNPYFSAAPMMPTAAILGPDPNNPLSMAVQQTVVTQQKLPRAADRLEPPNVAAGIAALTAANAASQADIGRKRPHDPNDDLVMMDMKSVGAFYFENFGFPGMVPYKRAAGDKSGVPVYQQNATQAYQQLLQPFVPVSCEYRLPPSSSAYSTTAANAAAFTGISLNKQAIPTTPSNSAAAAAVAAAAAASIPRYHMSTAGQLNQAFAQHFFPTLTNAAATLRPSIPGFPPVHGITNPAASTHLSELLAAAQFSNFTNNNSNMNNNSPVASFNANSANSQQNASSIVAAAAPPTSGPNSGAAQAAAAAAAAAVAATVAASIAVSNNSPSTSNNISTVSNSNPSSNGIAISSSIASAAANNSDEDAQPYKKLKTV